MCNNGLASGLIWGVREARFEGVAGHFDILIGGATAFGGDDGAEVSGGNFVEHADEALLPAVLAVFGILWEGLLAWWGCAVRGVGEAGFEICDPRQVECEDEAGGEDVDGGEGTDASHATEGLCGEV